MAMQKTFTRFPPIYSKIYSSSDGESLIEKKINSYDKIPVLNHDNGLIFPDGKERTVDRPRTVNCYLQCMMDSQMILIRHRKNQLSEEIQTP